MINDKKVDYKLVNIAILALIVYLMYHTGHLWIGIFNKIVSICMPFLIGFGVAYSAATPQPTITASTHVSAPTPSGSDSSTRPTNAA